jgi:Protein of unknown function (DUF2889)
VVNITLPDWQPAAGPGTPLSITPERRPGSVRRTTTVDTPWPGDFSQPCSIILQGRDLRTTDSGDAAVEASLDLSLKADLAVGLISEVRGVDAPAYAAVEGVTIRSGFGREFARRFPDEHASRPIGYSALSDLPGAFLVAGYSMLRLGMLPEDPQTGPERAERQADVCIGWATGSPIQQVLHDRGTSAVPYGPTAPVIEADDPEGWHSLPEMTTHTVRRRRALDVTRSDGGIRIWSHFRDSYAAKDHEMVMHEYFVTATLDASMRITEIAVDPLVLPWAECPGAVDSAQQLVGYSLEELDERVRSALTGPQGCTHLNSTMRALADVSRLA